MKLNEKTMKAIESKLNINDVRICHTMHGAAVYKDIHPVCTLDELSETIAMLEKVKKIVEQETGIVL